MSGFLGSREVRSVGPSLSVGMARVAHAGLVFALILVGLGCTGSITNPAASGNAPGRLRPGRARPAATCRRAFPPAIRFGTRRRAPVSVASVVVRSTACWSTCSIAPASPKRTCRPTSSEPFDTDASTKEPSAVFIEGMHALTYALAEDVSADAGVDSNERGLHSFRPGRRRLPAKPHSVSWAPSLATTTQRRGSRRVCRRGSFFRGRGRRLRVRRAARPSGSPAKPRICVPHRNWRGRRSASASRQLRARHAAFLSYLGNRARLRFARPRRRRSARGCRAFRSRGDPG